MYEKSSRCSLVRVCVVRVDGECALCVMRVRTRAVLRPRGARTAFALLLLCTPSAALAVCPCVSAVRTRGRCLYSRAYARALIERDVPHCWAARGFLSSESWARWVRSCCWSCIMQAQRRTALPCSLSGRLTRLYLRCVTRTFCVTIPGCYIGVAQLHVASCPVSERGSAGREALR